jgi:hypothetical protein
MEDMILVCRECGQKFVFTKEEQEFCRSHGIKSLPVKCVPCRKAKREQNYAEAMTKVLQNPGEYEVMCRVCGRYYVTILKQVIPDAAKVCPLCAPKEFETVYPKEDLALNKGLGYPKYKR